MRDEIRIRALSAIYCLDRLDGAAEREADELRVMLEKIAEPYNTPTLADVSQVQKQAERISYTIRAKGRELVFDFAEDAVSQTNWIRALLEMIL